MVKVAKVKVKVKLKGAGRKLEQAQVYYRYRTSLSATSMAPARITSTTRHDTAPHIEQYLLPPVGRVHNNDPPGIHTLHIATPWSPLS